VKLTPMILAGSLLIATSAFAQNSTGSGASTPSVAPSATTDGTVVVAPAPAPGMRTAPVAGNNTPNAVAGPNNSTGNMNTKGTGPGTTGTGSKGGSGNQ
jgi:hypothetical protein